jgi:hypothetical protein
MNPTTSIYGDVPQLIGTKNFWKLSFVNYLVSLTNSLALLPDPAGHDKKTYIVKSLDLPRSLLHFLRLGIPSTCVITPGKLVFRV